MKQTHLKIIRVILALLSFISFGFIFLDFREIFNSQFYAGITFLQFVPSLIKSLTVFSLASSGFIVIIVLTSLFGRVYCSTICPLGIMQDIVSWIRKKTIKLRKTKRKIHRYKYRKPDHYWRYGFLALPIILFLVGGNLIGIYLLDPYSIFGRIFSNFGQPVIMWCNNQLSTLLESMDVYLLYPEDIIKAGALDYVIPSLMLIIIVWFSFTRGRLYCNMICPVGTLLGLFSRISIFKIKMLDSHCTKCGKCAAVCKASCIDVKHLDVDFSRCVGCLNCVAVCPEGAIKYLPSLPNFSLQKTPEPSESMAARESMTLDRRNAVVKLFAGFVALTGLPVKVFSQKSENGTQVPAKIVNKIPTKIEPVKQFPVTPPGSLGIKHFTNRCTACHLCVSACPTGVLQPSFREYGFAGVLQPHMDYSTKYCNFDCTRCSEICPSGAILSLAAESKKLTQIGKVNFIRENCIVQAEEKACGSCSEHCPTQAVTMVPYKGNLTIPEIKPEICVGCGACEYACPVKPYKAIYIDGNDVHQVAKKPEIKELEKIEMEDFPF